MSVSRLERKLWTWLHASVIVFNVEDLEAFAQASTLTIVDSQKNNTMQLPDRVILSLDNALDSNLPAEVPGAAVTILTNEGKWFGASGFSDLENQISLQPGDRFEAGSITKTFVATTVLQLVEENQLDLEDTLTEWLPAEITDLVPNAGDITIEQILNHTSGITDFSDVLFNQALSNPTVFLNEWTPEQLVGLIDGLDPYFEPGTDWQYSNTNYILAGEIIEAVTGNSYGQEIRDRIIDTLNLDNTFVFGEEEIPGGYVNNYWDFDGDGELNDVSIANLSWAGAAGSVISNSEDLADFFDGLLVDGALLEPETLEQMLDTLPVDSPNYDSYGLGIGTLESRNRFWYVHRGQTLGFRSNLWYSPLEEITYVELLNGRSSSNLVSDLLPTYRRTITPPTPDIVTYEFGWTGQIAEFSVEGQFSYDLSQSYEDGIVREENLDSFDISFFDPAGNLLQTYEDNHLTFSEFNFAFDTNTKQILTDGIFTEKDGLNVGEKTAVSDGFTGLNLWSKSKETSSSLIHVDDWSDEFGFPLGYSSHEDIAFLTKTTAELIETGKVGETYLDDIQDSLTELGNAIAISTPANQAGSFAAVDGTTSLFLDFSLFETAGLVIQDASPSATPFSNQFQLAFDITDSTDFQFDSVPFTPSSGSIQHTGDIEFLVGGDALLSIGDFEIGFDGDRVTETNSGFYVADTLEEGLGIDILFDISNPERLIVQNDELTIADADLLLAPEFAQVLGLNDFVGADVGNTRIDAVLSPEVISPVVPPVIPPVVPPVPPTPPVAEAPQNLFGSNGDENLTGGSGNDNLYGNEGQNTLMGLAGNDKLFGGNQSDMAFGGAGDDTLYANEGHDVLSGGAGNDTLFAGGGDDVLMGVTGDDILYGNHGNDLFVFGNGDGTDTIMDFQLGMDQIGLVEGELVYADLSITQAGLDTVLGVSSSGETLAVLKYTHASALRESSFAIVPDVSDPTQAIALA